ncbi:MAG: ABC transporter permease [Bryobacterales bacterium]|nr:ABC transporter permease [Bryobacterales bacterium]
MNLFFQKLRALFFRRRKEDDLREELQFHLDQEAEELQAEGLPAEHARLAARRDLGNATLVQEETRAVWTWVGLEQLLQDCRYGLRTLATNKTFSLLAILSLALGIGANTAIYSFMDWLLMRSLPVANPESLVVLNWRVADRSGRDSVVQNMNGSMWEEGDSGTVAGIFPYPAFDLIRSNARGVFSTVFAYYPAGKLNLLANGYAEIASGEYVTGDYFSGLAVAPATGRLIGPDDDRVGAPAVAVLSFAYSQKRFGDAAKAPGQSISINNVPFIVAGVAPLGFFGVDPAAAPDFYIPLRTGLLLRQTFGANEAGVFLDQHYYWLEMMARLRPGVSPSQAQTALGPLFHRWVESTAANERERVHLPELRIREGATGLDTLRRQYSKPLYVLLAMVALILTISCVNIANLLLARATARRREIAVRLSIGAGRFRVIRQLLTESVLLSSLGGALGIVFAISGIRTLTALLANGQEDFTMSPTLNWNVLGAAAALSVLTGIAFGLAPAVASTRVNVVGALKETCAGQAGRRSRRFSTSQVLVAAQIGLSLVLLLAAGLFVGTLSNLQSIELGFNRESVLLFRMNARQAGHRDPEIHAFYAGLWARFRALPGVSQATFTHHPMLGQGTWSSPVMPAGVEAKPGKYPHILLVGPDFFAAQQIPVQTGRVFDDRDRAGATPVAVVNEAYAKTYLEGGNPIGQRITLRRRAPLQNRELDVVGVARNARYGALKGEHRCIVYLPIGQDSYYPVDEVTYALRTSGDPQRFAATVREIVRNADPRVPVTDIQTQTAQIDQMMNQEILFARLCTAFAVLALLIACVGLYGTMAYSVERRTGEIGIRVALGARRGDVVWLVLRHAVGLGVAGLALGLPVAFLSSRLVESFLYGVEPADPSTMLLSVGILLGAVLLAGYIPARRASRIDPMTAMRSD